MNTDLKRIYEIINSANNILILTHINPDGDAIGSMMALKLIIEKLNKNVDSIVTNFIDFMESIPHKEEIFTETTKSYDLTILVDVNSKERLGNLAYLYEESKNVIILDHHEVDEAPGVINYIDSSASSATMVIYDLIKKNNITIDKDIAYYLYLGLLTDTGGFVYNNTNSRALEMGFNLLQYELNHNELYTDYVNKEYNLDYLYLKKEVINNLIVDDKIAISFLSYETLTKYAYDTPKLFVDLGRGLKGVEVSLMFVEKEPNTYKLSLRSKKYLDVSKIAKMFGGGGHKFASGIDFIGNYEENKNKIIEEIKKELK